MNPTLKNLYRSRTIATSSEDYDFEWIVIPKQSIPNTKDSSHTILTDALISLGIEKYDRISWGAHRNYSRLLYVNSFIRKSIFPMYPSLPINEKILLSNNFNSYVDLRYHHLTFQEGYDNHHDLPTYEIANIFKKIRDDQIPLFHRASYSVAKATFDENVDENIFFYEAVKKLLNDDIGSEEYTFLQEDDCFAIQLINSKTIPVQNSPLSGESIVDLLKKGSPGTIGAAVGFFATGEDYQQLLFVTVPAGIIVCGTAVGIEKALREGLEEKIKKWLRRRKKRN